MNQEIWARRQRLDYLFSRAGALDDPEMQSHWARYLCVLTSGFLETSVRILFVQYAQGASATNVGRFVEHRLKTFQNAQMESIVTLTRQFSEAWSDQLAIDTAGELKDAVDSIVANRHLIAHGSDVGISYTRMKDYYAGAVKVIDLLRVWCDS